MAYSTEGRNDAERDVLARLREGDAYGRAAVPPRHMVTGCADKYEGHHDYLPLYAWLLGGVLDRPGARLLEIGVDGGHSLVMWLKAFPGLHVHGSDITLARWRQNRDLFRLCEEDAKRLSLTECDSTRDVRAHFPEGTPQFDVILDDGSHDPWDQKSTLAQFWPLLKPGGVYVIEDVHAFGAQPPFIRDFLVEELGAKAFKACSWAESRQLTGRQEIRGQRADDVQSIGIHRDVCWVYKEP